MTEQVQPRRVAKLSFKDGKYYAIFDGKVLAKSASKDYVVNKIRNRDCVRALAMQVYDVDENETHFDVSTSSVNQGVFAPEDAPIEADHTNWSINDRFEFLETLVQMIVDKQINSLIITGEGGLGKTHVVLEGLKKNNLKDVNVVYEEHVKELQKKALETKVDDAAADDEDDDTPNKEAPIDTWVNDGHYLIVKGFSTARALYRTLYENRTKLVIFDDCDSIQKDQNAINIIKSAADSYNVRRVDWYSENPFSDLPKSFIFEGQIIFISNMTYHRIDQAIRSRSMCVDLSMTIDQKIERMESFVESNTFMPDVSLQYRRDSLNFIREHKDIIRDLTIRTLILVIKIRMGNSPKWKELAEFIVRTN